MLRPAHGIAVAAVFGALTCAAEPETTETRIRSFFAEMEAAAESHEVARLKSAVAEDYADDRGNDRRAITQLLTYHFLRNQSIHLLSRITAIEVHGLDAASVRIHVAMAGRPIADAAALERLRADVYRFDFELAQESEAWQVTSADWQPALIGDF